MSASTAAPLGRIKGRLVWMGMHSARCCPSNLYYNRASLPRLDDLLLLLQRRRLNTMQFFALIIAFSSLLAGSQILAAPAHDIAARQVGDLQCNLDRLSIVADLAATQGTLKSLAKQAASDPDAAASIQAAQSAVSGAGGAIGVIAKALFSGQAAPADARVQVQGNLTAAHDALTAISSSDSDTTSGVKKALTQLGLAELSGEGVVKNCK
ncbi:hypothetical protein C8Q78DRAFT_1026637 [Trametes maxima]|nr:hypothetical protein C8Q78DRAFT_1026637 [Trametes maxima]